MHDTSGRIPKTTYWGVGSTLADLSSDGHLDILSWNQVLSGTGYSPGPTQLYLNNGQGVFADASSQLPPMVAFVYDAAVADINRDGANDIVIGEHGGLRHVWLNDGRGRFSVGQTLPPYIDTYSVSEADIDGDGWTDVFFGMWMKPAELWMNRRGTLINESVRLPPGFQALLTFVWVPAA